MQPPIYYQHFCDWLRDKRRTIMIWLAWAGYTRQACAQVVRLMEYNVILKEKHLAIKLSIVSEKFLTKKLRNSSTNRYSQIVKTSVFFSSRNVTWSRWKKVCCHSDDIAIRWSLCLQYDAKYFLHLLKKNTNSYWLISLNVGLIINRHSRDSTMYCWKYIATIQFS